MVRIAKFADFRKDASLGIEKGYVILGQDLEWMAMVMKLESSVLKVWVGLEDKG